MHLRFPLLVRDRDEFVPLAEDSDLIVDIGRWVIERTCQDLRKILDMGLHPGSGSQRPVIRNNRLERNNLGLFWCWGVKFGLARANPRVEGVMVSAPPHEQEITSAPSATA